jgi:hypothetical protein
MSQANAEVMLQSVAMLTAWNAEPDSTRFQGETFTSLIEHGDIYEQLEHMVGLVHGMAQVAGLLLVDLERATSKPGAFWLQGVAATAERMRNEE